MPVTERPIPAGSARLPEIGGSCFLCFRDELRTAPPSLVLRARGSLDLVLLPLLLVVPALPPLLLLRAASTSLPGAVRFETGRRPFLSLLPLSLFVVCPQASFGFFVRRAPRRLLDLECRCPVLLPLPLPPPLPPISSLRMSLFLFSNMARMSLKFACCFAPLPEETFFLPIETERRLRVARTFSLFLSQPLMTWSWRLAWGLRCRSVDFQCTRT